MLSVWHHITVTRLPCVLMRIDIYHYLSHTHALVCGSCGQAEAMVHLQSIHLKGAVCVLLAFIMCHWPSTNPVSALPK